MRNLMLLCLITFLNVFHFSHSVDTCNIAEYDRINCGWAGIRNQTCINIGCCFEVTTGKVPWCFYPTDFPLPKVPRLSPKDAGLLTGEINECRVVNYAERDSCGYPRITSSACESRGCCFDSEQQRFAWCFYPEGYFSPSGKAAQKFSGTAVTSKVFSVGLSDNTTKTFHTYASAVEWQLLKAFRYQLPQVKVVKVENFSEAAGYSRAHFTVDTVAPQNHILTLQQLTDSSVAAIRKRQIGIMDYTMFLTVPVVKDFDECSRSAWRNTCHPNSLCTNTIGSFTCTCKPGYSGDGYTQCDDVNECDVTLNACHQNATCTNTDGWFVCSCKDLFTGDGVKDCQEIITNNTDSTWVCDPDKGLLPVEEGNLMPVCHSKASCVFQGLVHVCKCREGFIGDGMNCEDVDECALNFHACHAKATCFNLEGSYHCTCLEGFTGDGYSCDDIDECDLEGTCNENSQCINSYGDHECRCFPGFAQDEDKAEKCREQTILFGTIPIVESLYKMLNEKDESYPTLIKFVEEQLSLLYSSVFQGDVDVAFVASGNDSSLFKHVIVLTGEDAHDITAAGLNESVLSEVFMRRKESNVQPAIAIGGFDSLEIIELNDIAEIIAKLPETSDLKDELNEALEKTISRRETNTYAVASVQINPTIYNLFNDPNISNNSSDSLDRFKAKLERDLYLAYSHRAPQVEGVEVIDFMPGRRRDEKGYEKKGLSVEFAGSLVYLENTDVPQPGTQNYSLILTLLEGKVRSSYSMLLNELFEKIDRKIKGLKAAQSDLRYDDENSSGSGDGEEDSDEDETSDEDSTKESNPESLVEVAVTNITWSKEMTRNVIEHTVAFKLPKSSEECTETILNAIVSVNASSSRIELNLSSTIFRSIFNEIMSAECNATFQKYAMLLSLTAEDVRLLFGIAGIYVTRSFELSPMPVDVMLTRRPTMGDLVEFLEQETNDTRVNRSDRQCDSFCFAKHLIKLKTTKDAEGQEKALLFSFQKFLSNDQLLISRGFVGIPTQLEILRNFDSRKEPDENDQETKKFQATTSVASNDLSNLVMSFEQETLTYKAVVVLLEKVLQSIYQVPLSLPLLKNVSDFKNVDIEVTDVKLSVEANVTLISLRHFVAVKGRNLSTFDVATFMDLYKNGVNTTKRNMFSTELKNVIMLQYIKPLKILCHPETGEIMASSGVKECGEDAWCAFNGSFYSCQCNKGFEGDGFECEDIDECETDTNACDIFAECENEEGDYECECEDGFAGNGFLCLDVDECDEGTAGCHANATCVNSQGGVECECMDGFTGNGKQCIETSNFYGLIRLNSSLNYQPQLGNASSDIFQMLSEAVATKLASLYTLGPRINASVTVISFLQGSIYAEHVVTMIGKGAHDVDAATLNKTFVESANAFIDEFLLFDNYPETLYTVAGGWIESMLKYRNRSDLEVGIFGRNEYENEARCITAGVRVNERLRELYAKGSWCASDEFVAKVKRDLFKAYSQVYPKVLGVNVDKISAQSDQLVTLMNPTSWTDKASVRFSGYVVLTDLYKFVENVSNANRHLLTTFIESELTRAYSNSISGIIQGNNCSQISYSNNSCSGDCKQSLLTVRVLDLRNDSSEAGLLTAEHEVNVNFPTASDLCAGILMTTGLTTLTRNDIELIRSIESIISTEDSSCSGLLERVFAITDLTSTNLIEGFSKALNDQQPFEILFSSPYDVRKQQTYQVTLDAILPKARVIKCEEMIIYHTVTYLDESEEEINNFDALEDIFEVFTNGDTSSLSYAGLPFDISMKIIANMSLLWPTTKQIVSSTSQSNQVIMKSYLPANVSPTFYQLGDITDFTTPSNNQPPAFRALSRDLKLAATFLLASRNFTLETISDLLLVLDDLSSPVRSLILSLISSTGDYTTLGINRIVGDLIVAGIELNL